MPDTTQPKPTPVPAILVYGLPTGSALPQASWFRAEDQEAVKAAAKALKFSVIELPTEAEKALTAGIDEGVLKGSGRMILGSVSAEVYRRIEEHARKGASASDPAKAETAAAIPTKSAKGASADAPSKAEIVAAITTKSASEQNTNTGVAGAAQPDPASPTDAWDRLQVGSYVVGKYWQSNGEPYGWWLGVIAEIDKNDVLIRWPDEPLTPALKIERKHVAILHPTYDVTREWDKRR
jgi:hypothetical protein